MVELIDSISRLLDEDLKQTVRPGGAAENQSLVL